MCICMYICVCTYVCLCVIGMRQVGVLAAAGLVALSDFENTTMIQVLYDLLTINLLT